MDQDKLRKPANLKDETWAQHLDWMDVMGKQVDENFHRHQLRVREDADRTRELWERHQQVLQGVRKVQSLFIEQH